MCSQNNNRNGRLLEIYDEEVKDLVDRFIADNNLKQKQFFLRTKTIYDAWIWMNKTPYPKNVDNQNNDGATVMAYISNTTLSNDSQQKLRYMADRPTSQLRVLCSIKNASNCTALNSWQNGTTCYFPINGQYTWYNGHYQCTKLGGGLAVLDKLDIQNVNQMWVRTSLREEKFWVGLTRTLLVWQSTETPLNYFNWANDFEQTATNNNSVCVELNSSGTENSMRCVECSSRAYSIICMEVGLPTEKTLPSVPTSNTTQYQPSSNDNFSNNGLSESQKTGLGAGLGVPLILLLIVGLAVGVYLMRKRKKLCFKSAARKPPQLPRQNQLHDISGREDSLESNHSNDNDDDDKCTYAKPVVDKNAKKKAPKFQQPDLTYVELDHSNATIKNFNNNNNNKNKNNDINNNNDLYYSNNNNSGDVNNNYNYSNNYNNINDDDNDGGYEHF
ncbi:hypothetical protein HELRODRAFT_193653 [Helobdella robusta]|uniref:C-type lectin domain-containing protein n=1 Tax=Helobdella robusta TaxID=6412 RepID=T1FV82_HELRO|nr:hypothetical protein HELRODRAFT_193653 [Helobdella robusta]ESN95140.1 hypothetical protein HELRODRAFT_193653 [Helobdella robusta]